ncbi:MAG: glycosyltransferase family 4 protein [Lentisphaeria bacterium]|nr:glycosyltransferase family 4 protein [Lentisphaeria bacterium]
MKLAFTIFRYFPFGGLQLDFSRFLNEGIRRGHSITVFYGRWEGDRLPGADYAEIASRSVTNWGRALDFENKAAAELARGRFDCVVGFNRMRGLDFYYAADNCFAEQSAKKHPLASLLFPRYRVFGRMERSVFAAGGKTVILYLTEAQKRVFQRIYGTEDARFRYLPPGVAPEFKLRPEPEIQSLRRKFRDEFKIADPELFLIQVCSAFTTKGVDLVLDGLAALPADLRGRIKYVVAGNETPGFRRMAEQRGLADRVVFAGPRKDIPELLSAADLMVHPARNEATGTVLAEAAVCGLPVICSENCGYAPLVKDAGGAVLPEDCGGQAVCDALQLTLSLPDALGSLRTAARAYAEKADFHHRTERFWDFIEEKADHA